jgi:CRP-like cAMP-binding protein
MAELDQPVRSASVQAIDEVEVLVLDQKQFIILLQRNPDMMMSILRTLSARLRAADEQIKNLVFQNVYGRLAITLIDLSTRYGIKQGRAIKIGINLSQDELAQLIGSSREIVNKALQLFQRQRLIEVKRNSLLILNKEGLRKCIA